LQLICGSTGGLLDYVGPQDVVAFTGSADTALQLRNQVVAGAANSRFNVEADSLNAAILSPTDRPETGSTWQLFLRDVLREVRQKAGQKCTAVRRILVPNHQLDVVEEALVEGLQRIITGNPADESVTMGPLATSSQLAAAIEGIKILAANCRIVSGTGERSDGLGSPSGKGYFIAPTLLRCDDVHAAPEVHRHEVFGPVVTLMPYDGSPADAARIVALAGGTLVTSTYGDDPDWTRQFVQSVGSSTGRIYIGSEGMMEDAPGSGVAMPQLMHGGPGRAGGGAELGGWLGVRLYMQRLALQGHRAVVETLTNTE
jgi:oxepin-CoA hydrolase/3-oxo-5,6-dehydrosuberyl-CoA semialdehyde dehydrogenase